MTPIERASRASFEARADWNHDDYKWDNATTIEQNAEYASVKAAISALFQPSEAMLVAGSCKLFSADNARDIVSAVIIAAIQAALSEEQ